MDDFHNGLVEKIIKELDSALAKSPLTEFDIVPVESTKNKTPVLYVNSSVALESWCVKHVYNYCYGDLIEDFLTHPKRRLSRVSGLTYKRIMLLLNPTLLINPDVTTLWNKRRELMSKRYLDWVAEMTFTRLVLSRKTKCNDAFSYRRFVIEHVMRETPERPPHFVSTILEDEFDVCTMTADKCPNNYHSWDHRRWTLEFASKYRAEIDSTIVFYNEYKFIVNWTARHVSDYSCFHYRQHCLKKLNLLDERWPVFEKMLEADLRENVQKFIEASDPAQKTNKSFKKTIEDEDIIAYLFDYAPNDCSCYTKFYETCRKLEIYIYELIQNTDFLKFYKYHEALWYHRRFIVSEILTTMYDFFEIERVNGKLARKKLTPDQLETLQKCQKCGNRYCEVADKELDWVYNCPLYKILIQHEKAVVADRRKDMDRHAGRHENYLKCVHGLAAHY